MKEQHLLKRLFDNWSKFLKLKFYLHWNKLLIAKRAFQFESQFSSFVIFILFYFRLSIVRSMWWATTATGPWCQTWTTFSHILPSPSGSWQTTSCSPCGSTFSRCFKVNTTFMLTLKSQCILVVFGGVLIIRTLPNR